MCPRATLDVSPGKLRALVLVAAAPVALGWLLAGPVFGLLAGALIATLVVVSAIRLESGEAPPRGAPGAR